MDDAMSVKVSDKTHESFMRLALAQAQQALDIGEIPVGAVVVKGGEVISAGYNLREKNSDPTAHAEVIALREAARKLSDWRLDGCTLYVTLEPCPMCAGAAMMARLERVVFGAFDERCGCAGSVYELCGDAGIGGSTKVIGGVLEEECERLLARFFHTLRGC